MVNCSIYKSPLKSLDNSTLVGILPCAACRQTLGWINSLRSGALLPRSAPPVHGSWLKVSRFSHKSVLVPRLCPVAIGNPFSFLDVPPTNSRGREREREREGGGGGKERKGKEDRKREGRPAEKRRTKERYFIASLINGGSFICSSQHPLAVCQPVC